MNKRLMLSISLILLTSVIGLVYASAWTTEYGSSFYKGWNLVYGFVTPEQIDAGILEQSNIKAIYAFIPTTQKYARLYPDKELNIFSTIDDDEVSQMAMFVYSDKTIEGELNGFAHFTEYWLDNMPEPLSQRQIYKGWNFVGITSEMIPGPQDTPLKDIKGNCNIEKSFFFNADMQKWEEAPIEYAQLEEKSLGSGWVIKVSSNCKLGSSSGSSITSPPSLPLTTNSNTCTDTDGGANSNIQGTTCLAGECGTDYCENGNLVEYFCDDRDPNEPDLDFGSRTCPNGCSNGACL